MGGRLEDQRVVLKVVFEVVGVFLESLEFVALANELGDYTTEEILRDELETLEEHAHHFEHYLEDDTLVLESATH